MILSDKSKSLWAKKSKNGLPLWLPLYTHLADSAGVAAKLWEHWLSAGAKKKITEGIEGKEDTAQKLFVFLAAIHDLGKATPVFQAKESFKNEDLDENIGECMKRLGIPQKRIHEFSNPSKIPHTAATQILLESYGADKSIAAILGGHHGKPQSRDSSNNLKVEFYSNLYHLGKEGKEVWQGMQRELLDYALYLAEFSTLSEVPKTNPLTQTLLCGLVIMADWIASSEELFPLINVQETHISDFKARTDAGWDKLDLPPKWESALCISKDLYLERFQRPPNSVQIAALEAAKEMEPPGIIVIEAPMGMGKTEAALASAEVLARAAGRTGIFFALPTQATSDGIFPRLLKWLKNLEKETGKDYSVRLAHGRAQFNEQYQKLFKGYGLLYDEEKGGTVHSWFNGRKRSLLSDFVIGTIDQLLMMALKQKHVMLRHLGLANKVVVIDECHAYDAYMNVYLKRALEWLGKYAVPVVVLSATLSSQRRREVIRAYAGNKTAKNWEEKSSPYPVITYTNQGAIQQRAVELALNTRKEVEVQLIDTKELADTLKESLSEGGCAGVIVNTVKRSQKIARELRALFGKEVLLLHSRFLAPDRNKKERELIGKLGKEGKRPNRLIVVGTQVLEQSLDIDFDILATDLCPMDLLLQRMGRLHRHERKRPLKLSKARCLVMEAAGEIFEKGARLIYGGYLLARTKQFLPNNILIPEDIALLVQKVYDGEDEEGAEQYLRRIEKKEEKAKKFIIDMPMAGFDKNILGFLDTDVSDQSGEAAVRDSEPSLEVILIRSVNGELCFLPEADNYGGRSAEVVRSDTEAAKALACQRVGLPYLLCAEGKIAATINALEQIVREYNLEEWYLSSWLQGELFLVLDEHYRAELCGYALQYSEEDGLAVESLSI